MVVHVSCKFVKCVCKMQPSWNLPFLVSWHFQGWRHRSWIYSWDRLSWTLCNGTWCSVEWTPWGWRRSQRQSALRVPSQRSPWSPYRKGRRCCTIWNGKQCIHRLKWLAWISYAIRMNFMRKRNCIKIMRATFPCVVKLRKRHLRYTHIKKRCWS